MDHGLARAGFRHVFFCESDPWRRTVLEHHWPGVPIWDDVRSVQPQGQGGGLGAGDGLGTPRGIGWLQQELHLLCGGFPCQDLSVAGQRRGLAGERSSLFFEFARIIDAVRPRWVLVENVPGLLSSNDGRDFGIVLGTLADLGYGVGYRVLDSRYFGVPQRRRRVFILGTVADGDPRAAAERAGEVLAVGQSCDRHPPTGTKTGPDVAVASLSGLGTGGPDDNDGQAGRVISFYPTGSSEDGFWQHDVSPPMKVGTGVGAPAGIAVAGTLREHVRPGSNTDQSIVQAAGVRRLTPVECERLQALPDNWTNPTGDAPDSRRYAALGDAVTSSVAEWIGRRIMAAAA